MYSVIKGVYRVYVTVFTCFLREVLQSKMSRFAVIPFMVLLICDKRMKLGTSALRQIELEPDTLLCSRHFFMEI